MNIPDLVIGKVQANVVARDKDTRRQLLYIQEVELIRFEKARLLLKVKLISNTGLDIIQYTRIDRCRENQGKNKKIKYTVPVLMIE